MVVAVKNQCSEDTLLTLSFTACEFSNANFSLFGTGGCGCVANNTRWPSTFEQDFPTYYRIQRCKNVLLANIMDQGSRLSKPQNNPFNEIGCNPDSENKILVEDLK